MFDTLVVIALLYGVVLNVPHCWEAWHNTPDEDDRALIWAMRIGPLVGAAYLLFYLIKFVV